MLVGVGGVATVLATTLGGGGTPSRAGAHTRSPGRPRPQGTGARSVRVAASLLTWRLPAPVSREVVVASPGRDLWVLGGMDVSGGTVATSYLAAPATGAVKAVAPLAQATHDAAGTLLGSRALVVGGGSAAPASEVQLASAAGGAEVSAQLAAARSDGRAATIGGTAYVVGGYDGPSMDTAVLATSDGRSFRRVATLPVAVRYPTVAVVGGALYVLGGQDAAGTPVATVQRVEVASGRATVAGTLGVGLAASVATTVGGTVYLVGGLVPTAAGVAPTTAVYAYIPGRPGVRRVASLPVAVANAGGTRIGKDLYVVGGENGAGTPVADVQAVSFRSVPASAGR